MFANDEFASGLRDDGIGLNKQSSILKQPTKSSEVSYMSNTNFVCYQLMNFVMYKVHARLLRRWSFDSVCCVLFM